MTIDRRSLLRIIGLGGAGGVSSSVVTSRVGTDQARRSLTVYSPRLDAVEPPRSNPVIGSSCRLAGALTADNGGALGRFHGTRTVLASGPAVETTYVEHHVFEMSDGALFGTGISKCNRALADHFAITGGTGAYGNVRGTYQVRHDDWHVGGDGCCRFDLDLIQGV